MSENLLSRVPHLTTALTGPLQQLEKHLLSKQCEIEAWLRVQWRNTPAPIYSSVDLRNAGFKLAPIDTNLFPAGFNNLNSDFLPLSIQAVQITIDQFMPGCRRILLVPENHTRNQFYFESLATLQEILLKAGFEARIGSLIPELVKKQEFNLPSGRSIFLEPILREGNRIKLADFSPCFVLLNNDLSNGIPEVLQGLEQTIVPAMQLGWASRLKSVHFQHYTDVSRGFAELIGIDPWFINPLFSTAENIDFLKREGEEILVEKTAGLLAEIQKKYNQYQIPQKPFVIIKADAGTYGMGVMTIYDAEELRRLNRKQRTHMSTAKGNRPINQVLLQEGVYTFETWEAAVAEPVVYMIGPYVVGGFYRVHAGRCETENLNSPGMQFAPLAFVEACNNLQPWCTTSKDNCANRFYAYGVIARLAALAAAREQKYI